MVSVSELHTMDIGKFGNFQNEGHKVQNKSCHAKTSMEIDPLPIS